MHIYDFQYTTKSEETIFASFPFFDRGIISGRDFTKIFAILVWNGLNASTKASPKASIFIAISRELSPNYWD